MLNYLFFGITLLIVGILLRLIPIKKNWFFGYRTFQSMKSNESWRYANVSFGKWSIGIGITSLLAGIVGYWLSAFDYQAVVIATAIALVLSLVYIEIQLFKRARRE